MQKIFIPKETVAGETRVAATPETVKRLVSKGHSVAVEAGAGQGSAHSDDAYREVGASICDDRNAGYADGQLILKLHPPQPLDGGHEADLLAENSTLVSFVYPGNNQDLVAKLVTRKVTSFAMELVPRISRAQKMDALSSQSNIAGYKAVIMAADTLGKLFPLMMTAAGTITPARVVILGAGVAGLQAIATAKRLGAVVEVSDIRPAVKEQVESLGGRFIEVATSTDAEDAGGYAKEASEDFKKKQEQALRDRIKEADVVITTALIPGRPAPLLVPRDMVESMRQGSVVVDLAAEAGGNCELTQPGEVIEHQGVTILGTLNIASLVPVHASDMYAKNLLALVQHLLDDEGGINVDLEDEITAGSLVTRGGEIHHAPTAELLAAKGSS
jgi:NAD(P) transhydrogenase subunit alpha